MKGKIANILAENVVFIVFTLLFITVLFLFVARTSSSTAILEQIEAKKIALMIDTARPGTTILLNVEDLVNKKSEFVLEEEMVRIEGNMVIVKLNQDSQHIYSFFNNVKAEAKFEKSFGDFLKIEIK